MILYLWDFIGIFIFQIEEKLLILLKRDDNIRNFLKSI